MSPAHTSAAPAIVISIDLELRWGLADVLPDSADAYRTSLEGVPEAVSGTLALFAARGVGATWATVGALACDGWDEHAARAPTPPRYRDARLRFGPRYRALDPSGRLHFAPGLVREIARTAGQEVASHTFGHIYLREAGCEVADIASDAEAARAVLSERAGGAAITSFVFPRNQVAHTRLLQDAGIVRWRTNPRAFYWEASADDEQSTLVRGLRLVDAVLPLGRRAAPATEMRAGHFVRFRLPRAAWRAHRRRIVRDAARMGPGEALHLWWHPHNLGDAPATRLAQLRELIDDLASAAPEARFLSMRDADPRPLSEA